MPALQEPREVRVRVSPGAPGENVQWGNELCRLSSSTPEEQPPSSVQSLPPDSSIPRVWDDACTPAVPQICTDVRLLANLKELEEPFEKHQIGE